MPLTKMQQEYLQSCTHRYNVKCGATGSGKSYVDIAVTIPQRQLVVHQRVEAALLVAQPVQVYHRHAIKTQLQRRHEPPVALHDLALALGVGPHPDGVAEADLAHALLDLADLLGRVLLCVSRVLLEPAYGLHSDREPAHELLYLGRRQPLAPSHPASFRPDHCRARVTGGRPSTSS